MKRTTLARRRKLANAWSRLVVCLVFVAVILPFVPIVIWSFALRWQYPSLIPQWSLRAWTYVFTQKSILNALGTSVLLSGTVTIAALLIGLPAARVLGMYRFRGKPVVETILTLPAIIPGLLAIMGIQFVFIKAGLMNSFVGVVLVHLVPVLPYTVMSLTGIFVNYQADFEDQARVLGAGPIKSFALITIPIIFPGIVVASLNSFLVSWSQYLFTIMIGGSKVRTLPTELFAYLGSGDYALTGAVSVVFIFPAVLLLILTSKFLSGDKRSMGGIKSV